MRLRRIDPGRDAGRLRAFLSAADPGDYLLEDLEEWTRSGRLWVGEDRGEWVAFGRLEELGDGEAWVSGMRVAPARRGQGLGGQLLQGILSDARTVGSTAVRAVIEDPNLASRRLFARFGFRSCAELTLRRGIARPGPEHLLHQARAGERPEGPVGWLPALADRVDVLPGEDGGRYGKWRPSLVSRWASEGKLYLGPGLAAAVQVDWWNEPRTLWVNPLQGATESLFPALDVLTYTLKHEEWQAFLPSTEVLRAEYSERGTVLHPSWGDRVQLYELEVSSAPSPDPSRGENRLESTEIRKGLPKFEPT